jgi:hypothetical protein
VLKHLFGLHALEFAPAQRALVDGKFFGLLLAAVFGRNPAPFELGCVVLARPFGIGLPFLVQLVEPLHEQQIGDLLDGGEWVADAAAPEFVPELVDLASKFGVVL